MIINADSLVPHLKAKVRPTKSDASRHLLCPACGIRTKLNTLGDGRKKCSVCGKKFRVHKASEGNSLKQCAEILMCFCLDFSANRAAKISHHRYRLVASYYEHFRRLLTEKHLPEERVRLLSEKNSGISSTHDSSRCKWCKTKLRSGTKQGQVPVFGVQFKENGHVYIDPLKDDEAVFHFHTFGSTKDAPGRIEGYAGFICCGKFHRFSHDDGSEKVWTWIRGRVRNHHGIWKRNTGYYLKELEWKYNHRALDPESQAKKIIELMPSDFLAVWSIKTEKKSSTVQKSA